MLHILAELSATDKEIKDVILANFSDIPSTAEAAAKLQSNFSDIPSTAEAAAKLQSLQLAKKDSYIRTLDDAFKQAREIDRECSFVDVASGRYNEQTTTKSETQINELDDSFQDCDINAMSTRSTNRSTDGSFNRSFDQSSSRNSSYNSSFNSRPNFRSSNGYLGKNSQNRQNFNRDNSRKRGYQQNTRFDQRNNSFQNRYDNNQDRNRFDNRRRLNKYQHHRNQPRAQVIFKYTNQKPLELMQTVRNFINFMKTCPASIEQFKSNKISPRNFHNEVNKSEIHTSS